MIDRLAELEARHEEIGRQLSTPEVASNPMQLAELGRELARLEPIVTALRDWRAVREELDGARAMADDPDEEIRTMAREEIERLVARETALEAQLRLQLVPRDPNDDRNVIVEIRGAEGGAEAGLWAGDLMRMYLKYAELQRWKSEIISLGETEAGGIREAVFEIRGEGAYSRLKFESGVHRVQRVPVTEASGRIHTSTATVAVMPEPDEVEVEIRDDDLRIDVFRSGGHGGQSVNTTDSAVRITHLPTNEVVQCQDERSQLKNKLKAMAVLRARLYERELATHQEAVSGLRRSQVGTGERAEKIRTYNFPENRLTDHRVKHTVHRLDQILEGDLQEFTDTLQAEERRRALEAAV
jgi:peptide chain release factor 1